MARNVNRAEWSAIKAIINAHPRSKNERIGRMRAIKRSPEVIRLVRHSSSYAEYRYFNHKRHDTEWHHNRPQAIKNDSHVMQASLFPLKNKAVPSEVSAREKEGNEQRDYIARLGYVVGMGSAALILIALMIAVALVRSWK